MPDWLTARPVAHRGLHDASSGVIENSEAAFRAAIAGNYSIECDIQITADGEAMVHHDDALGRLTNGAGTVREKTAADLKQVAFKGTRDRMLTLGELCDLTAGKVALVIELKSRFDGETRLSARAAKVLSAYKGHAAVMSFDPEPIGQMRDLAPDIPRGLVAMQRGAGNPAASGPSPARFVMQALAARLNFLAYRVQDLSSTIPMTARNVLGLPLLTWTVRTPEDRTRAARYADQMIFEGFRP